MTSNHKIPVNRRNTAPRVVRTVTITGETREHPSIRKTALYYRISRQTLSRHLQGTGTAVIGEVFCLDHGRSSIPSSPESISETEDEEESDFSP